MRRSPSRTNALLGAIAFASAALAASPARAATPCSSLQNTVIVTGSTAVKPLLAELAKVLVAVNPPITVVYLGQGSCAGVTSFYKGTPLTGAPLSYWDSSAEQTCAIDPPGAPIDVAVSDVFSTTCDPSFTLSNSVNDFPGPIQAMTFVVPNGSTETAISARAAYMIFGFGADSGVAPWTDPMHIFQRNAGSGTQQMIGVAINVPAAQWQGTSASSSDDMKNKVSLSMSPQNTIGILAADVANDNAALVKVLPYQHYDQTCGYYPDSDASRNDKRNVRDGHYAIWGPLHFLTHVNTNTGNPLSAAAKEVIDDLTGAALSLPGNLDLIKLEAQHHVVPACAMRVSRSGEAGPLSSFMPARSCACYFDVVSGGTTDCEACAIDQDCPTSAPRCQFGYCEIQ